ncbi:MAG: hypothetical protein AMK71_02795 [Nitrospira bacterium SG8_35_4]|nr:MAG: hypothetical protein AMK71_02795 [Nitrospira bacterium SG8_35_4]
MIIECIKDGVALTNRNLQLVVIRVIVSFINVIAFGVFLGIPLIITVAYLGFDVAHAREMLPYMAHNPLEFVSRYLGLILLLLLALLSYLIFSSMLYLYTLGGMLGSLRNSFTNAGLRFALPSFFREANANFSRLFWLLSLVFLGITVLLIACAGIGGMMVLVMSALSGADGVLNMFLRSFAAVFMIILCMLTLLASVIFSVYSAVISVAEKKGAMESVNITLAFLKNKPQALLFFIVLILAVITAGLLFFSVQIPLRIIPFISVVTFLINTFFSSYLAVVLWGSLVTYYMRASGSPVYEAGYEI